MKAILFTNTTKEDFSYEWGKVQYDFPVGQQMMLESHLALHFAKHLAVRELNKEGKNTGGGAREKKMNEFLTQNKSIEAKDSTELTSKIMNTKNPKATTKPKVKKSETTVEEVKDIEEFEGATDETIE